MRKPHSKRNPKKDFPKEFFEPLLPFMSVGLNTETSIKQACDYLRSQEGKKLVILRRHLNIGVDGSLFTREDFRDICLHLCRYFFEGFGVKKLKKRGQPKKWDILDMLHLKERIDLMGGKHSLENACRLLVKESDYMHLRASALSRRYKMNLPIIKQVTEGLDFKNSDHFIEFVRRSQAKGLWPDNAEEKIDIWHEFISAKRSKYYDSFPAELSASARNEIL